MAHRYLDNTRSGFESHAIRIPQFAIFFTFISYFIKQFSCYQGGNIMLKKIWNYLFQSMVMCGEALNRMNGRI